MKEKKKTGHDDSADLRMRPEEALRYEHEMLQTIIDSVPVMIAFFDREGHIQLANRFWQSTLSWSPEELMRTDVFAKLYPDTAYREYVLDYIKRAAGSWGDFKTRTRDGRVLDTSWINVSLSDGSNIGIGIDITERKRAEEALRESEEKFRLFFENSNDGMLLISLENQKINNANNSMSQMLGYSLEELKKLGTADIHPKVDLPYVEEQIEIQSNDGLASARDLPMKRKDGSVFYANVRGAPIMLAGKKYLMGIFRDITERKRAEEAVQASLREKEILLKEVHHRIKNNMSSMMSLLSLQASALKNPEAVAALLEARDRMRSMGVLYDKLYLSENLREMSIKDYLPPLVDEIVGVFPNRGQVKIEKRIDDIVLGVKVLSPLGIIVNELITNAMQHAFTGREDGSINVSTSAKDDHVTLIIEDNGNGIPESVEIANSSGFGLQLVGMLTAQLDGTIQIERRKGARFVLEFDV